MRYRRSGQRHSQPDRAFARRFGYETVKETGGTLLQHIGSGLGALGGFLGGLMGLPPTASVITGAIVGTTVGAIGKAYINATVDERREKSDKRAALRRAASRGSAGTGAQRGIRHPGGTGGGQGWRGGGSAGPAGAGRSSGPSPMNQIIGKLEQVIEQFDRASTQLHGLMTQMWESQNRISGILAGSRPEVVRRTHDQADGARLRVLDAANLARQAAEDVRAYRSGL